MAAACEANPPSGKTNSSPAMTIGAPVWISKCTRGTGRASHQCSYRKLAARRWPTITAVTAGQPQPGTTKISQVTIGAMTTIEKPHTISCLNTLSR